MYGVVKISKSQFLQFPYIILRILTYVYTVLKHWIVPRLKSNKLKFIFSFKH